MTTTPLTAPRTAPVPDQSASLRAGVSGLPGLAAPANFSAPSFAQPVLTSPGAMTSLAGQQIDDLVASMERAAMYSGEIEANFSKILSQTKDLQRQGAQMAQDVANSLLLQTQGDLVPKTAELPDHAKEAATKAKEGPKKPSTAGVIQSAVGLGEAMIGKEEAGYATASLTDAVVGRHEAAGGLEGRVDPPKTAGQEITFGKGMTIGQDLDKLREHVAKRANTVISGWGKSHYGEKPATNAAGQYIDSAGNVTEASAHAGKAWEAGMARVGRATGALDAIGAGEGVTGLVGEVAGKFAGPIGVALGAAQLINSQVIDQRKKNAFYQNIYGGDNTSGFAQRAQEEVFSRLGTFGLMGHDEAAQLFQSVSAMGLQGNQRQQALDFATGQYSRNGMDTQTSAELIQQATNNGVTSMMDLNDALNQVAASAKEGGKSLKDAQAQFVATYKTISSSVATGQSAISISAGVTAMTQKLGHQLGGVDLSGMLQGPAEAQAAVQMGMTPAQLQMKMMLDPSYAGKAIDTGLSSLKSTGLRNTSMTTLKPLYDKLKAQDGGTLSDDSWNKIGVALMSLPGNNPELFQQDAAAHNLHLTMTQVPAFAARMLFQDPALNAEQQIKSSQKGFSATESGVDTQGNKLNQDGNPLEKIDQRVQDVAMAKDMGIHVDDSWNSTGGWASKSKEADSAYFSTLHQQGGKRYASIEALLRANKGQGIGDDTKIRVKDSKTGKMVDVTLAQAIKYHASELESGNSLITAGADKGQRVGDITKIFDNTAASDAAKQQKITLEAKGRLADFIKMTLSGGSDVDAARRAGKGAPAFTAPGMLPNGQVGVH